MPGVKNLVTSISYERRGPVDRATGSCDLIQKKRYVESGVESLLGLSTVGSGVAMLMDSLLF